MKRQEGHDMGGIYTYPKSEQSDTAEIITDVDFCQTMVT